MLAGALAPLAGCAVFREAPRRNARLAEMKLGAAPLRLTAKEREVVLVEGAKPSPLWLFDERPFPVIRMRKGDALAVTLKNELSQHSSIHWHGVRVPNAMDGVPYLTQLPVQPGEEFTYRFTPPDAGTFFFHPHCNSAEQIGRGLIGALIVEDDRDFDDDIVLILKDWRLGDDGQFLPFLTNSGASRAGSFGTLRTVNAMPAPRIATASRANIRLRLINADPTRISHIGIEGADAKVIAIDGNAVEPFALDSWQFGPGMRLDLALRNIGNEEIRLRDYFAAEPVVLATLGPGGVMSTPRISPHTYPSNSKPDFSNAWRHTLELGAGLEGNPPPDPEPLVLPDGTRIDLADSLCLAAGTFWTLDGQSWPLRDHNKLPPPLFTFARGQSVVLEFANTTSRAHPIHIHGHTMTVLSASLLARPVHRADTVLVLPNERVSVGFVADNPGNWMIHCHIIEHQETGMMGWFRVT